MKRNHLKKVFAGLLAGMMFLTACGNSAEKQAEEQTAKTEDAAPAEETAADDAAPEAADVAAEGNAAASGKKIAFITGTGGLGDKSFNDLGYQGIKVLMDEGIPCDIAEPKAISEMEGLLRNFSDQGDYALIIGMGGDMVDALTRAAADYPEQNYMVLDGLAGNDKANIRSVMISQTDCAFLVGAYAALMENEGNLTHGESKNIVGVVGGMDVPIIRTILTAYECGARYINPETQALSSYVGDWNDPGKGAELTQDMYEKGARIVFQAAGASGLGVIESAKKHDLYAIGYDGNQNSLAPDSIIGSGARGLDAAIVETAKSALADSFQGGDFTIGMKDDPDAAQILLDENNITVPDEVKAKLEKVKEFLIAGAVEIPAEPDGVDAYLQQVGSFAG